MIGNFFKLIFVMVLGACVWTGILAWSSNETLGIVTLDGYEEAVALCGEERYFYKVVLKNAYIWTNEAHNILYVVNRDHLDDLEVKDLERLAVSTCNK